MLIGQYSFPDMLNYAILCNIVTTWTIIQLVCVQESLGCTDVEASASYRPIKADCLKLAHDQGRLYPVNQKGVGKHVRNTLCEETLVLKLTLQQCINSLKAGSIWPYESPVVLTRVARSSGIIYTKHCSLPPIQLFKWETLSAFYFWPCHNY